MIEAGPDRGWRAGLRGHADRALAAATARGTAAGRPRADAVARAGLLVWAPVLLAVGIGGWFSLRVEPGPRAYGTAGLGFLLALWTARAVRRRAEAGRIGWDAADLGRLAALAVALALAGFLAAGMRAHLVAAPVLDFRYYGPIEGRVVEIDRSARDRVRLTLDQVVLRDMDSARTPVRVRLSLTELQSPPAPGARIMLTGHLGPNPGPAEPNGFDFRRAAFFERLGAVGYTRNPIVTVASAPPRPLDATTLRMRLSRAMQDAIGGQEGAVAAALMTGDRSGIAESTNRTMRDSNLYHIVSISGLHMSMLAAFVYAALRLALAGWQAGPGVRFAGRPLHKIAAVAALAAATAYLWLSGGGVPTERAYLMVAVMLGAIVVDRRAISLRTVAVAAVAILLVAPEALVTPGFQMSFAATVALILLFPAWSRRAHALPWLVRGAAMLVISSLIAGLATSPIAAAHFNRSAQYGLVANLLVVPVMGALVMPAGVIAALLAPVGLAGPALWVMGLGTRWMLYVAGLVAGWGGAVIAVPAPHWAVLPMLGGGASVAVLALHAASHGRLARWSAGPAALVAAGGLALWAGTSRPDVLIAGDGSAVGVQAAGGRTLSRPAGAFVADSWLRADGDIADADEAAGRAGWTGPRGARQVELAGRPLVHLSGKGAAARAGPACAGGGIVVLAGRAPDGVGGACLFLDEVRLSRHGARAGWIRGGRILWMTADAAAGQRLWSSRPVRRAWGLMGDSPARRRTRGAKPGHKAAMEASAVSPIDGATPAPAGDAPPLVERPFGGAETGSGGAMEGDARR